MHDQIYTLTATGKHNCTASDQLSVKVLKPVLPPNAFSPNGDNINDKWVIYNLSDYPDSKVEVFNRYGQRVFQSTGYPQPWDGSFKGNPLPVGTYYYVITLRNGFAPLSGYVAIIR
jgi:gliding motility-associated-like protein